MNFNDVPDSTIPLIGYRRFLRPGSQHYPEGSIAGGWEKTVWKPGAPMEAECKAYQPGSRCGSKREMNASCGCGLYIWTSFSAAANYEQLYSGYGWLIATVAIYGRIFADKRWARGEFAEVLCVVDPEEYWEPRTYPTDADALEKRTEVVRGWARAVSDAHGIPMLGREQAELFSSGYGSWFAGARKVKGGWEVVGVD